MKKIFILLIIILTIFLLGIINCQQVGSSGGGSGGGGGDDDIIDDQDSSTLDVVQVDAGVFHSIVLFNDGTVKCWGGNYTGQLGYGDKTSRGKNSGEMGDNLSVVDLGTGKKAIQIAAGGLHNIALLDDGTVKCWGENSCGQLGYGDKVNRGDNPGEMGDNLPAVDLGTGRIPVHVAAGKGFSAVLFNDGTVKCWGDNGYGQLGYGDTEDRGDESGEMGDSLLTADLGTGRTVLKIDLGYSGHVIALLDNGKVKCWGRNFSGELGYGDGFHRGDEPNEMGDNLPYVDLGIGYTAVDISAGQSFSVAILSGGNIKCWGTNGYGQLGYGDDDSRGRNPGEMGEDLPFVDIGTGKSVRLISAGNGHTAALLNDGTIKCWGYNNYGQLGYGDMNNRGDDLSEIGNFLLPVDLGTNKTISQIVTNEYHNIVLFSDGSLKCWGCNFDGQLGYGDTEDRGDEPGDMGEELPFVSLW